MMDRPNNSPAPLRWPAPPSAGPCQDAIGPMASWHEYIPLTARPNLVATAEQSSRHNVE